MIRDVCQMAVNGQLDGGAALASELYLGAMT